MKTKKLLSLLLACLVVLSLSACESGAPAPAESAAPVNSPASDEVRTLNVIVSQDPGSLHPFAATGNEGGFLDVMRGPYDILFDDTGNGSYEWRLCTGFDTVSDIQYTLHLREGVTFSNGNPFTADDVIFSLNLCRDDPTFFLNVKAVDFEKTKKIDDYTVDLWLTAYDASQFPGFALMYIFDEESYDASYLTEHSVGTGPYEVVEYVSNSHIIMEAREDYWGEAPDVRRIYFKVMDEDSQKVNALEINEADYSRVPTKDVEYVESIGTHTVTPLSTAQALVVYFNCNENNIVGRSDKAREAIMYAIDRDAIVNLAFNGQSSAPRWPLSEANSDFEERFAGMDDVYKTGYSPEKAKALAEEAGLVGQTLRVTTNGTELYITCAEIIQSNLGDIGINVEIVNYDQASYNSVVGDDSLFEMAIYGASSPGYLAVDVFTNYPKFIPLGWAGAEHDAYMAQAAEASAIASMSGRSDSLFALTESFLSQDLWYPLAEQTSPRAVTNSITNVTFYLQGVVLFNEWKWTD